MEPPEEFESPASTFVASRSSPTELRRHVLWCLRLRQRAAGPALARAGSDVTLVGALGFEPRTYGVKARCAEAAALHPHRVRWSCHVAACDVGRFRLSMSLSL